jgi:hypothetical protein
MPCLSNLPSLPCDLWGGAFLIGGTKNQNAKMGVGVRRMEMMTPLPALHACARNHLLGRR